MGQGSGVAVEVLCRGYRRSVMVGVGHACTPRPGAFPFCIARFGVPWDFKCTLGLELQASLAGDVACGEAWACAASACCQLGGVARRKV